MVFVTEVYKLTSELCRHIFAMISTVFYLHCELKIRHLIYGYIKTDQKSFASILSLSGILGIKLSACDRASLTLTAL